jgi:hypothetical protein
MVHMPTYLGRFPNRYSYVQVRSCVSAMTNRQDRPQGLNILWWKTISRVGCVGSWQAGRSVRFWRRSLAQMPLAHGPRHAFWAEMVPSAKASGGVDRPASRAPHCKPAQAALRGETRNIQLREIQKLIDEVELRSLSVCRR